MCITIRHDMTLAVKVALNLNTTNQQTNQLFSLFWRNADVPAKEEEHGYDQT